MNVDQYLASVVHKVDIYWPTRLEPAKKANKLQFKRT